MCFYYSDVSLCYSEGFIIKQNNSPQCGKGIQNEMIPIVLYFSLVLQHIYNTISSQQKETSID